MPYFDVAVLESNFFSVNGFNIVMIMIGMIEIHSQLDFEKYFESGKVWNFFRWRLQTLLSVLCITE